MSFKITRRKYPTPISEDIECEVIDNFSEKGISVIVQKRKEEDMIFFECSIETDDKELEERVKNNTYTDIDMLKVFDFVREFLHESYPELIIRNSFKRRKFKKVSGDDFIEDYYEKLAEQDKLEKEKLQTEFTMEDGSVIEVKYSENDEEYDD